MCASQCDHLYFVFVVFVWSCRDMNAGLQGVQSMPKRSTAGRGAVLCLLTSPRHGTAAVHTNASLQRVICCCTHRRIPAACNLLLYLQTYPYVACGPLLSRHSPACCTPLQLSPHAWPTPFHVGPACCKAMLMRMGAVQKHMGLVCSQPSAKAHGPYVGAGSLGPLGLALLLVRPT